MDPRPWWLGATLALWVAGCGGEPATQDGGTRDAVAAVDASDVDADPRDADSNRDSGGAGDAGRDGGGADSGQPPCTLTASGPIRVDVDGAVVENLQIVSDGEPGITIRATSVTVRNVHVSHRSGSGIDAHGADDLRIENVFVEYLDAPASGANPSSEHNNIYVLDSARATIEGARLFHGSTGIYLVGSPDSVLRRLQGEDFRGPFPRGQLVQWDNSDNGLLEDFSVVNPIGSWPEDNVNVYQSQGVTIRRGFIDGNNSTAGVGVIFDGGDATGRVEDVDAVRMGNGCFSGYDGADGNVFLRTRCRDNICGDQGRGLPLSGALMWAGRPGLAALRIEDSTYFAPCDPGNIVWPRDTFAVIDLREQDFTPRPPIALTFCWE